MIRRHINRLVVTNMHTLKNYGHLRVGAAWQGNCNRLRYKYIIPIYMNAHIKYFGYGKV